VTYETHVTGVTSGADEAELALCCVAFSEMKEFTVYRRAEGARRTPRRLRVLVCTAAVAASVLFCAGPGVATPPPPNPTDGQLNNAQALKNHVAADVGRLSALVSQATIQLQQLQAKYQLAEQKFALAVSKLQQAEQQAAAAQAAVVAAAKEVDRARANVQSFVRNSYITPTLTTTAGGLLTAKDPNALLQTGDYVQFVTTRHLDAMSALDRATVAKSNADAKAKALVQLRQQLKAEADAAQQAARDAFEQQRIQQAILQSRKATYQSQLNAAQIQLATLNGQRAKFVAWQVEQARIAAEKARQERLRREAAERAAAAEAARLRNANGGGSVDNSPLPPSGSMGGWSADKGQAAVNRAMRWLGTPYAWAGGGYGGPTYGVNSPGTDGANDSTVYGFDCSGLTMYAWAPQGLYMDHYAASQFSQAGSFHPSPGQFMPGDLLFWGGPSQGDIHHVAMYIGGGNVIQAPNSGDVVKVTPWDQVSPDYFGATRPLT
jgi:cell wall-associated NlpC family hydrolase